MKTLVACESLPEIIRNDENLYEGNLIHYFRIIFTHAQNLGKPYHNFRHMMHVTYLCYQACFFYSDDLSPRQMRNLLIAAMFHDFDHPGMQGNDDLNIERAVRGMKKYLLPEDWPEAGEIEGLIRATEYPHKGDDDLCLTGWILRDADLSQGLSVAWIQQIVFGLATEWNTTPFAVLGGQEAFTLVLKFHTEWAKELFPQKLINEKLIEIRELNALLDGVLL